MAKLMDLYCNGLGAYHSLIVNVLSFHNTGQLCIEHEWNPGLNLGVSTSLNLSTATLLLSLDYNVSKK